MRGQLRSMPGACSDRPPDRYRALAFIEWKNDFTRRSGIANDYSSRAPNTFTNPSEIGEMRLTPEYDPGGIAIAHPAEITSSNKCAPGGPAHEERHRLSDRLRQEDEGADRDSGGAQ